MPPLNAVAGLACQAPVEPDVRPLVFAYVRPRPTDTPAYAHEIAARLQAFVDREGLTMPDLCSERHGEHSLWVRSRLEALQRLGICGVVIPLRDHLEVEPAPESSS